jgi:transposase-like protein
MSGQQYHCPECNRHYDSLNLEEIDGECEECGVTLVDEDGNEWEVLEDDDASA